MKSLAIDPWRKVQFAVVTSRKVAYRLKINKPSSVTLYRWNTTVEHPQQAKPAKAETLIQWVDETVEKTGALVDWITPSGIKSKALDLGVRRTRATFILFTPRSLILGISPYVDVVCGNFLVFVSL